MTNKKMASEDQGSPENRFRHRLRRNPMGANHDVAIIKSRIEALKSKIISEARPQIVSDPSMDNNAMSPVEIASAMPEMLAENKTAASAHQDLTPVPDPNSNFDLHDANNYNPNAASDINDHAETWPEAEKTETADGFQIFKARSAPKKSDPIEAPQSAQNLDQEKSAHPIDPVPMEQDAIEEALKLIEDEDAEDIAHAEDADGDKSANVIGFTPSSLTLDDFNPGSFGDQPPEPMTAQATGADEMDIAAALSEELGIMPEAEAQVTEAPEVTTSDSTASDSTALDIDTHDHQRQTTVLDDQHRQNIEIGQSMAQSIKSIISDEVDQTLDRIARQAVRDALKAHRGA